MKRLVIIGIAVVALLPGLLSISACSSSGAATGSGPGAAVTDAGPVGELHVHIGLFGGPARPNGDMALSNSPVPRIRVTAIDTSGQRWSARTNNSGTAEFDVAPGRYTVVPHYCGGAHHRVLVTPGRTAHVQVSCPVP